MGNRRYGVIIGCAICGLNLLDALGAWLFLVPAGLTAEVENNILIVVMYQYTGNWVFAMKISFGGLLLLAYSFSWDKLYKADKGIAYIILIALIYAVFGYLPLMLC